MIRIPLLKDNHNHLFSYANLSESVSLFDITSKKYATKIIINNASSNKSTFSIFTGWFDSFYTFNNNDFSNLPPLIICNNSLHNYFLNNSAKDLIIKDFPEWIKNFDNQNWIEKNLLSIIEYISSIFEFSAEKLKAFLNDSLSKGVISHSDMFVRNPEIIEFLRNSNLRHFIEIWTDPGFYFALNDKKKEVFKGVKIFTDGAIGTKTAAIDSYKTTSNPILIHSYKDLSETLEKIIQSKTKVAIHAIGDIAIEQTLRIIENFKSCLIEKQVRLEHVQFINKQQALKAKKLGIVLCMQPNFNMDSIIYSDRLPEKYIVANNPFRMLIDEAGFVPGKDLIFGSDGMPTGINEAIRQSLFPPVPSQRLNLEEFIEAYCVNSLEYGFIDLDIDPLKNKIISSVITEFCF
ncbi:MAG TPA: amidohydrolase family protein [Bacteroidales bacterium]|jgi:predicted amidohydrolase YtcJ|nr:amidohydrolase family protein [Bacteroidales bacterium]HOL97188.1 amidohydrolase family protein [Bacteroidales bacterium]HOM35480.1 amidohydrolase family protein [Bacteroidales bacterium]HPD24281.1 amidohydrolase family protein [Bacteroidales bacterium]HRS98644.1 amidohydrolase family protein [Bacteroidales bacterium]